MEILWMIIIGFVVGLLARFFMPGRDSMGFVLTTLLGIVGAVLVGLIGQAVGLYSRGEPAGFFAAVIGAMLVLFLYRRVSTRAV